MSKVVVISGHPNLAESWTNTVILEKLETSVEDIEVRRLDALYSDYKIDVETEQKALIDADVIVLQYPYYWYSVPALLKKWIDDVFSFNFAYGPEGDKLKNKHFILSFTVGGPEESYDPQGYNHFTIEQLAHPLQQTAYLAGMNYQKPIYTHRMVYVPGVYNTQEEVEARASEHADRLIAKIDELTNSAEAQFALFVKQWFDMFDQLPEDSNYFLGHLTEDLLLAMPEGTFKGHAGFRDWYTSARNFFKPGIKHLVEQISLKPIENEQFEAELRIRVQADTTTGESINQLFNENWTLSMSAEGKVSINDYRVQAV